MAAAKQQLVRDRFYDVGNATQRATEAIYRLLGLKPESAPPSP
jgi:hypothetical protein